MERFPRKISEVNQLIQLGELLNEAIRTVTDEWSREKYTKQNGAMTNGESRSQPSDKPEILPSWRLHQAQRTILAISGTLTELVAEPHHRLQEFSAQYWEARALAVAAERRIPDLLHEAGDDGMDVKLIAAKTGIEQKKLTRILGCLCSNHIFRQTGPELFANNRISAALVHNDEFRAYIMAFHLDVYMASERLPKYLLGPNGASYDAAETPWQEAMGTRKPKWDWLAERVDPSQISNDGVGYPGVPDVSSWVHLKQDANGKVSRPELENFGPAMIGAGKVSGAAHPFDYSWGDLPRGATVVDVGGGVGGFAMQLLSVHSHLNCVVQDRAEVIKQAEEEIWPQTASKLLHTGRVKFLAHDFFQPNPVQGADVYWMRAILHDWSDDYCVQILSMIRDSMSEKSRLLICDQLMNTTNGCDEIDSAPSPLPANYGYYTRYHHSRDMSLMGVINGIERTPPQFHELIEKAGLKLIKFWETRSLYGIIEVGI